ncbi:MAG: hypothetical protein ABSH12_06305 [Endomicrobiales bacterium]
MSKIKKKVYSKPKIRSEKIIETAALACGKCQSTGPILQGGCTLRSKVS